MALNEEIVTGRKFRKCIDVANKLWQRISFWTMACDVWFEDGKNAEEKLGNVDTVVKELKNKLTSFDNTKSSIVSSALGRALGMAASNTWAQIVSKITGVVNRGTLNWSGSNTTYTVPAGYYSGGTLDSRASYTAGYNKGKADIQAEYAQVKTGSFSIDVPQDSYSERLVTFPTPFPKIPNVDCVSVTNGVTAGANQITKVGFVVIAHAQPDTSPVLHATVTWRAWVD